MSVTAVVTNHDYARFLPKCLETALEFCDEVLVYDDGSTDDSLDVLSQYPVKVKCREVASGGPVWGSNEGIKDASCTHILFLDADNWLWKRPHETDADYTCAPLLLCPENGIVDDRWDYDFRQMEWTWDGALRYFQRTLEIPVPWGGVWRTDFIRDLRWRDWETTRAAPDFRTCIDWLLHKPTITYVTDDPFLVFRQHSGQMSDMSRIELMKEAARAADELLLG